MMTWTSPAFPARRIEENTMPGQIGDTAADFTLPSPHHGDITLRSYRGTHAVVLSFHVLDFTGG